MEILKAEKLKRKKRLRNSSLLLLIICTFLLTFFGCEKLRDGTVAPGRDAPALELHTLDGKPVSLKDFKNKKNVVLYVWYDNEFGYTKQVIRLAKYVAKVQRHHYY